MNIPEELEKLHALREKGAISEQEYQESKQALLSRGRPVGEKLKDAMDGLSSDVNMWGMFIHLSQFCGYVVPLAGLIVPIVLWQLKKNESEILDKHGRIVMNWIITEFILAVVFGILSFVLIGIPLLIALGIGGIILPIVGGVKANNGEVWPYPFSIRFFPID